MDSKQLEKLLKNLTQKQREIIGYYHKDDMAMLKKICHPIIERKGVPQMEWDELYDVASDTLLESIASYDESRGSQFKTYLTGNIKRAYYDWTRDQRRGKRCNLKRDEKGKIVKGDDGKPIIISNISLNGKTEEGSEFGEMVDSGFRIEDELSEEIGFSLENNIQNFSPEMQEYLSNLSKVQIKVLELMGQGYDREEILEKLHITKELYKDSVAAITSKKATRKIKKTLRGYKNVR